MDFKDKLRIFQERFHGRRDVYGLKWMMTDGKGNKRAGYTPVCGNIWKDFCHLKKKDGIQCSQCEYREYVPVSDATVAKHIRGEEEQLVYMLQEDGRINFGAIDFDFKPGKEKFGYDWSDVERISGLLDLWKIPHGIARSTGQGFHIYFFFEGGCQANLFRSLIMELYDIAGFTEQARQGQRPIPEFFPKQSHLGNDGLGNGIKPPMLEPAWEKERNCFVTSENQFIPLQWEYLDGIPRITEERMRELIKEHNIPVVEETKAQGAGEQARIGGPFNRGPRDSWQPPLMGSIDKLLDGCQALRGIRDKCKEGKTPGHHDGVVLWHMALATTDGRDWFLKNVPGWGKTEGDLQQLEYSTSKNYSPHTCTAMQNLGVCKKGTRCFKKQPPKETVEGRLVVREDVPESQWPEPSPIRYAYGRGEDYLLKLMQEAEDLKAEKDPQRVLAGLNDLVYRAQVFDDEQVKTFRAHLKKVRLVKVPELNRIFKDKEKIREKETTENLKKRRDVIQVNGVDYRKLPLGFTRIAKERGRIVERQICSFNLRIEEKRTYTEDDRVQRSTFAGTYQGEHSSGKFEISTDEWVDPGKSTAYFQRLLGEDFLVNRKDMDIVRQVCQKFSSLQGIESTSYLMTQGWYGDTYVMPSVLIDRDGVRPNTEQRVDLTGKSIAASLDFQLMEDGEFRETMMHIKTDLMNAWPREWIYFALSHAFLAVTLRHLRLGKKPALFLEGLTGSGKTELMHTISFFFGSFKDMANLDSTSRGVMELAYFFKDALLVLDDYKGASKAEVKALGTAVQTSYDGGSVRAKMRRDGSIEEAKGSRALLFFTGEEFISSDSAKIARTILLKVDKHDTERTLEEYERCLTMREKYSGVMPRFIHWFLNQDHPGLRAKTRALAKELHEQSHGRTNAQRVAYNLAASRIGFELFCAFMQHSGIADAKEIREWLDDQWIVTTKVNMNMVASCEEEQNGLVFARLLRQMIEAGEVSISGGEHRNREFQHDRKPQIGFIRNNRDGVETVYLYPDVVYREVMRYGGEVLNLSGSKNAIARQLMEEGIVSRAAGEKSRSTSVLRVAGQPKRVWEINMHRLGFVFPAVSAVPDEGSQVIIGDEEYDGIP